MMVKKTGLRKEKEKDTKDKRSLSFQDRQIEELKRQLVRALADYDNLRKRVEQEKKAWIDFSTERVLIKLLPILDLFESAQKHLNDSGLAISITEFKKILYEEGIEEIIPKQGDEFNTGLHEAVEVVDGKDKGKVAELVLTGWKFKDPPAQAGGKVIRHAKVKVYGKKEEKEEELEKEMARGEYM